MTEGQPLSRDIGRGAGTFRSLGASQAAFARPHVCEGSRAASEVVIEDGDISMLCGDPDCHELPPGLAALGRVLATNPALADLGEARNGWAFMRASADMPWRAFPPEES